MATYNCNYGSCGRFGSSEEMISLSGAGFRERYCSWFHAALGAIHHTYPRNFNTYWSQLAQRAERLILEAQRHFNADNPTEDIAPKSLVG